MANELSCIAAKAPELQFNRVDILCGGRRENNPGT